MIEKLIIIGLFVFLVGAGILFLGDSADEKIDEQADQVATVNDIVGGPGGQSNSSPVAQANFIPNAQSLDGPTGSAPEPADQPAASQATEATSNQGQSATIDLRQLIGDVDTSFGRQSSFLDDQAYQVADLNGFANLISPDGTTEIRAGADSDGVSLGYTDPNVEIETQVGSASIDIVDDALVLGVNEYALSHETSDRSTALSFGTAVADLSFSGVGLGVTDYSLNNTTPEQSTELSFGSATTEVSLDGLSFGLRDFSYSREEYSEEDPSAPGSAISNETSLEVASFDLRLNGDGLTLSFENTEFEDSNLGFANLSTVDAPILANVNADRNGNVELGFWLPDGSAIEFGNSEFDIGIAGHDSRYTAGRSAEGTLSFEGSNIDINARLGESSYGYTADHTQFSIGADSSLELQSIQNAQVSTPMGELGVSTLNNFQLNFAAVTSDRGFIEFSPTADNSNLSFQFDSAEGLSLGFQNAGHLRMEGSLSLDQARLTMTDSTGQGHGKLSYGSIVSVEGSTIDIQGIHNGYDSGRHHGSVLTPLLLDANPGAGFHWQPAAGVMSAQTPGNTFLGFKILHTPGEVPSFNSMSYLATAGTNFNVSGVPSQFEGMVGLTSSTGIELFSLGDGGFKFFDTVEVDHLAIPTSPTAIGKITFDFSDHNTQQGLVFLGGLTVNPTHMADSPYLSDGPQGVVSAGIGYYRNNLQVGLSVSKGIDSLSSDGGSGNSYPVAVGLGINYGIQF